MSETLDSNLSQMQNKFRILETQFREIYEFLPFDHNDWETYSPKLSSFISDLGPQIIGLLNIICKQLELDPKGDHFGNYFSVLNEKKMLEIQSFFVPNVEPYHSPFDFAEVPTWWTAYNKIKHAQPDGEFFGTMKNAILAFGALYILHHIAELIQSKGKDRPSFSYEDILDSSNWIRVNTDGNYIKYQTATGKNTTLYSCFQSMFFVITKRYIPTLKGKEVFTNDEDATDFRNFREELASIKSNKTSETLNSESEEYGDYKTSMLTELKHLVFLIHIIAIQHKNIAKYQENDPQKVAINERDAKLYQSHAERIIRRLQSINSGYKIPSDIRGKMDDIIASYDVFLENDNCRMLPLTASTQLDQSYAKKVRDLLETDFFSENNNEVILDIIRRLNQELDRILIKKK
jgi:hypothetical protein